MAENEMIKTTGAGTAEEAALPLRQKPKRLTAKQKRSMYGFATAALPLLGYLVFNIVPLGIAIATMFVSMDGYDFGSMQWNNFQTFKDAFADSRFLHSIGVSFLFIVPHLCGLLISLFLSALLAQKLPAHKFFKALYFVPYICSTVAISVMWRWIFDQNVGIFNDLYMRISGAASGPQWFSDSKQFTIMLLTVMVWQAPGYGIVMFSAAFTAINPALYEAAELDGANAVQKFRAVTFPAITPTIFYLLIAGLVAGLQTFDIPQIFAGDSWTGEAGPKDAALSTVLYIYYRGIMFSDMPVASVMSMTLFVIIFTIMVINYKLSDKWVSYDV